jgi:hypothetical protein
MFLLALIYLGLITFFYNIRFPIAIAMATAGIQQFLQSLLSNKIVLMGIGTKLKASTYLLVEKRVERFKNIGQELGVW